MNKYHTIIDMLDSMLKAENRYTAEDFFAYLDAEFSPDGLCDNKLTLSFDINIVDEIGFRDIDWASFHDNVVPIVASAYFFRMRIPFKPLETPSFGKKFVSKYSHVLLHR